MTPFLNVEHIKLTYHHSQFALENLSFSVKQGEIACILGASGSGKSTILRAIAGFEPIYHGNITLDQQLLASSSVQIAPEKRKVGMMFQDYALFPHMNITQNIAFGLMQLERHSRAQRVQEMLRLIDLTALANAFPHELSGGQQQRVALARSLAPQPKLLLLDEPFSNLDLKIRKQLAFEVKTILKTLHITAIMVTHQPSEAFAMADQIGTLENDQIQFESTSAHRTHYPTSVFA